MMIHQLESLKSEVYGNLSVRKSKMYVKIKRVMMSFQQTLLVVEYQNKCLDKILS